MKSRSILNPDNLRRRIRRLKVQIEHYDIDDASTVWSYHGALAMGILLGRLAYWKIYWMNWRR